MALDHPAPTRTQAPGLPFGVVGGKRSTYEALRQMADEQADNVAVQAGEVFFRKEDLARRVQLSGSRLQAILRWLQQERYLTYEPGNPGRLSRVQFQPNEGR